MRIHLAANHAGYELAGTLREGLAPTGHEVIWHGPPAYDEGDDYPPGAIRVAKAVVEDEDAGRPGRGVIVGGDGAGETVAANKVNGARAVPALSVEFVRGARFRADVNVLVLPAALLTADAAAQLLDTFLTAEFSADLDDARRLVNTAEFETAGTIEGWLVDT